MHFNYSKALKYTLVMAFLLGSSACTQSDMHAFISIDKYRYVISSNVKDADVYFILPGTKNNIRYIGKTPYDEISTYSTSEMWQRSEMFCRKPGYFNSPTVGIWKIQTHEDYKSVRVYKLNCTLQPTPALLAQQKIESTKKEQNINASRRLDQRLNIINELSKIKNEIAQNMTPENTTARITAASADVYDFPCSYATKIASVPQFAPVHIIGSLPSGWVLVKDNDNEGWVHSLAMNKSFIKATDNGELEVKLQNIFNVENKLRAEEEGEANILAQQTQNYVIEKQRTDKKLQEIADRKAAAAAKARKKRKEDGELFGKIMALGAGAAIIGSSGLDAGTQAQIATAMTEDVQNNTGGTNLKALQGQYSSAGNAGGTGKSSASSGASTTYTFKCDDGTRASIPIPPGLSADCDKIYRNYAKVYSCNYVDQMESASADMKRCQ